jgi:hypothetical protein
MVVILGLVLALSPYKDAHPFVGAQKPAAEIEIALRGQRYEAVQLNARVPSGWIVTFCSPKICARFRASLTLPASGSQSLELKLIRNDEHAQLPPSIMVKASERAGATYSLQGEH